MSGAANKHSKHLNASSLVAFSGDLLVISSQTALPPGSRITLCFDKKIDFASEAPTLHGKIVSVTAEEDVYQYFVRLHSLSRRQREMLTTATRKPPSV
jgi:hypothetical protein